MSRFPRRGKDGSFLSLWERAGWGLVIPTSLLLAACVSASSNNSVTYAAYTYACCVELTAITVWHPGQQLTLHWTAVPSTTTDASPHKVVLQLTLTGPFNTVDQLKSATTTNQKLPGTRSIKAAPLSVTDQVGGSPVSELDLPADLPPGYYNLDTETASGSFSAGGGAVVQVAP